MLSTFTPLGKQSFLDKRQLLWIFPGKGKGKRRANGNKGGQNAWPQVATLLAFPEPRTRNKKVHAVHP